MKSTFTNALAIILLAFAVYIYHGPILTAYHLVRIWYAPCSEPIRYHIGAFDSRFPVSKEMAASLATHAAALWNTAYGKNLFVYDESGDVPINFIYDSREATTQELKNLGASYTATKSSYLSLKEKYTALENTYTSQKVAYDTFHQSFLEEETAYSNAVAYWNSRGGAPQKQFIELQNQKTTLASDAATLESMRQKLNATIENLNTLVPQLNMLARELNINAETYNTIGSSQGKEFDAGLYTQSATGREIDIYQFENNTKLIRVLAHELGHALGLPHVDNPQAIMYYVNSGVSTHITADDRVALTAVCTRK